MSHGSALLIMDYQDDILASQNTDVLLPPVLRLIAAARAKGMPVLFVVVGFRPGHPEIASSNKGFSALKEAGRLVDQRPSAALGVLADEPVVTKKRISAFAGSDLDVILRGYGAQHLILCGVSTSGVVLSTTRQAADLDYRLTIVSDGCADSDAEVHRVLMDKIFPRQARVVDAATLAAEVLASP